MRYRNIVLSAATRTVFFFFCLTFLVCSKQYAVMEERVKSCQPGAVEWASQSAPGGRNAVQTSPALPLLFQKMQSRFLLLACRSVLIPLSNVQFSQFGCSALSNSSCVRVRGEMGRSISIQDSCLVSSLTCR